MPPWHSCGLHLAQTNEVWPETQWQHNAIQHLESLCHSCFALNSANRGTGVISEPCVPCPSWHSSQCQPPGHPEACHTHSCVGLVLAFGALDAHTWQSAIVGNETSHVNGLAVDGEVPHAADELPVVHREILRQVWHTTKEERAS